MVVQVAGPDKNDGYANVRTAENSRVSLLNNAAFTGAKAAPTFTPGFALSCLVMLMHEVGSWLGRTPVALTACWCCLPPQTGCERDEAWHMR